MVYEAMGWLHVALLRLREREGQGTVEYVGLILLVAVVLAGIVKASGSLGDQGLAKSIVTKLKDAVDSVGSAKK
jgi:Flp pilus assembly pilin Flp